MLAEAKMALRVTDPEYDMDIARLLMAGAQDLKIAGVILPGSVKFNFEMDTAGEVTVNDLCTLDDALCTQALFTYVRAHFGSPPDYDKLADSYELQKVQLMHATGYTDFYEEEEEDEGIDVSEAPEEAVPESDGTPEGDEDP